MATNLGDYIGSEEKALVLANEILLWITIVIVLADLKLIHQREEEKKENHLIFQPYCFYLIESST